MDSNSTSVTVYLVFFFNATATTGIYARSLHDAVRISVPVDDAIQVSDMDSPLLQGATVTIDSGYVASSDVLGFVDTADITGSFDPATGYLSLSGAASPADYEAALRSVTKQNTKQADPDATPREVTT